MHTRSIIGFTALLFITGCAHHQPTLTRPAIGTRYVAREAGFTAEQTQFASDLCFKGMPKKISEQLGPTEFAFHKGYVLEYSSLDKVPIWVCEHVVPAQLGPDTNRSDKFKEDPSLKGPHSTNADYAKSGYDKGHQAPAANQGQDQKLQDETFFLSNMAPQLPRLNENSWKSLETLTRTWVKQYSEAWEITGPVFYDPKEDDPRTADGTVNTWSIGKNGVTVPTHFYKIVIVKDGGKFKAIAFVMPNVSTYKSPYHLEQYIRSVRWIEDHTGLDFMPVLTAQQSQDLEAQPSAMWQ